MQFQLSAASQDRLLSPYPLQGLVFTSQLLLLLAFNSNQLIIILDMDSKWKIFLLTFLSYSLIHAVRTSWSSLKYVLNSPPYGFSAVFLGTLDMIVLLLLAVSLNLFGPKIEEYGPKKFLIRGMIALCLILFLVSILLIEKVSAIWPYAIIYPLVGIFSCVGWPACLFILSQYFQKGMVFSFWNGNSQFGDFVALITSYIIIQKAEINSGVFLLIMVAFLAASCLLDKFYLHQKEKVHQDSNAPDDPAQVAKQIDELVEEKEKEIPDVHTLEHIATPRGGAAEQSKCKPPAVNFLTVWTLPGVPGYILSFLFVKSVNAVIVTWLVFYLSMIGMVSESRIIGLLWAISTFLGGLLGSYLNPTFDKKIFIGALFASSILFIFLEEIHLYPNDIEVIILVTVCGLIFGGPFTVMNTSIAIFLSEKPAIRNIPGAKAAIISAMEGYGLFFSGISLLIIPVIGVIDLHWIASLYCGIAAGILLFEEIRESKDGQDQNITHLQRETQSHKKAQAQYSVHKISARLARRHQIVRQKLSKTFSNFDTNKQVPVQPKPQKDIKQDHDLPALQEEFKDFQKIQINLASPVPEIEFKSRGLTTSQRSEHQDDPIPSSKPLISDYQSLQMPQSEQPFPYQKKTKQVPTNIYQFEPIFSKSNSNVQEIQPEGYNNRQLQTII